MKRFAPLMCVPSSHLLSPLQILRQRACALDSFHPFIEHLMPRPAILYIELSHAESSALLQIRQRRPLLKERAGLFAMELSGPVERLWVVGLQSTRELIRQRCHILDELSPPRGPQLQA